MSVSCEIKVSNPTGGVFKPGNIVVADIKYTVHREEVFNNITVSLKGMGYLDVYRRHKRAYKEQYVHNRIVLMNNPLGFTLPLGPHEERFNFRLPENIPPSVQDCGKKQTKRYYVRHCFITYYVSIEFGKPGLLSSSKKFKKIIIVMPNIIPKLPTTPTTYEEKKFLTQFFTFSTSVVDIKVTIENSVISPGSVVRFNCEVLNDTNIKIESIQTKLIEVYTFQPNERPKANYYAFVNNTSSRTGRLESGYFRTDSVEFTVPPNKYSIEGSGLISRSYIIEVIVELPIPHRNAVLKIPIQVGDTVQQTININNEVQTGNLDLIPSYAVVNIPDGIKYEDAPPSYWEAMGEEKPSDSENE